MKIRLMTLAAPSMSPFVAPAGQTGVSALVSAVQVHRTFPLPFRFRPGPALAGPDKNGPCLPAKLAWQGRWDYASRRRGAGTLAV